MWAKIIATLTGQTVEAVLEYKATTRKLKADIKLEELRGKAAYQRAKSERAEASEGRDHEWELESIRNSGWKDELVIIILSIPLVGVFIPGIETYVAQGFEHLEGTPDWYRWLIVMIYAATFGIRVWRRKL